jgi:hypothetical protein
MHTCVIPQYLLGVQRLAWQMLFLDRLEPEMCVEVAGPPCPLDGLLNRLFFLRTRDRFQLSGAFALVCNHGARIIGLSGRQVLERVNTAAFRPQRLGFTHEKEE